VYSNTLLIFQAVVLTFILAVQLWKHRLSVKCSRWIFVMAVGAIAIILAVQSIFVFFDWSGDPAIGQFFLPPHQSNYSYFFFYILTRIFAPYLISLIFALVLLYLLPFINRRSGDRFFEPEEPYLAALSIFLVGHPGWFVYLIAMILTYLGWHLWNNLRGRGGMRLPLYNLWIAVGISVLIIDNYWLVNMPIWKLLKI
jgi:hypothetical protein